MPRTTPSFQSGAKESETPERVAMARLCHCSCSRSWPQGRLRPPWAEMRWSPDAQRAAVCTFGRSVPVEEGVRRDCACGRADSVELGPPGGTRGLGDGRRGIQPLVSKEASNLGDVTVERVVYFGHLGQSGFSPQKWMDFA